MKHAEDLTGRRFGLLTVIGRGIDYVSPSGKRRSRWLCLCECGNQKSIQASVLLNGKAKSCGCLQKKLAAEHMKSVAEKQCADIANERFGSLVALKRLDKKRNGSYVWLCRCDCGKDTEVTVKELRSGNTRSCGCLRNKLISAINFQHGNACSEKKSRLYNVWVGMRQRCNDPNHKSYMSYGGRGIRVCEEWSNYTAFELWAMNNGYNPDAEYGECTIDRIDVNGDYEPSNCRWVPIAVQNKNRRTKT